METNNSNQVREVLTKVGKAELKRCKDDPVYFFNKYVRKEGQKEMTKEEYDIFVKGVQYLRNNAVKYIGTYAETPLYMDQVSSNLENRK